MNKVELKGIVGMSNTQTTNGRTVTRFTLATNRAYKDSKGDAQIEVTWHNVCAWKSRDIPDPSQMQKGAKLHVIGRIRNTKIQNEGQPDRFYSEIQAREIRVYDKGETMADEMN